MPNTLVITKGHPFEREPFFQMLEQVFHAQDLGELTHVEHPAACSAFAGAALRQFECVLCYDMPGIKFRDPSSNPNSQRGPEYVDPGDQFKRDLLKATEAGTGFVFLHHAIAGWPAWEPYAQLMGGRFCYTPQRLRGVDVQDSGYRHKVPHSVQVVAQHPVTAGVDPEFQMVDELYLYEVFEDSVTPLLRSDYEFTAENFYSAARVVEQGQMFSNEGWQHPQGSNLVGWTRQQDQSRIVYLQGGDDPEAYANSNYQRLLGNAIRWAGKRE